MSANSMNHQTLRLFLIAVVVARFFCASATAQSRALTDQGTLNDGGAPATGPREMNTPPSPQSGRVNISGGTIGGNIEGSNIQLRFPLSGYGPALQLTNTSISDRTFTISLFRSNTGYAPFVIREDTPAWETDRFSIDHFGRVKITYGVPFNSTEEALRGVLNFRSAIGVGLPAGVTVEDQGRLINLGINTGREEDTFASSTPGFWIRADTRPTFRGFHFFKKAEGTGDESEMLTVDESGNVGIDAPMPGSKLHVKGTGVVRARIESDSNAGVGLALTGQPKWSLATVNPGSFQIFNDALGQNAFWIDGGNNSVGIGTNAPTKKLHLVGDSALMGNVGINTTIPNQLLTVNGDASKPGGGSWNTFSDDRLKNINGRFTSGLKAVMQLQPIRYEYRPGNVLDIKSDGESVGFSAQAVQKIIPEAVIEDQNGYLLVNNDPIMWTMLNAIKEQQKEIEQLREANIALQTRLQGVERRLREASRIGDVRRPVRQ